MQDTNKNQKLAITIGDIIKDIRQNKKQFSLNKLANEYDLGKTTLRKIENGWVECKFATLWKIAEALDMKTSDFVKIIEDKLGKDFKLIDE